METLEEEISQLKTKNRTITRELEEANEQNEIMTRNMNFKKPVK